MKNKTFLTVIGVIFFIITVLHFCRLIWKWEAVIGGLVLPMWISWLAVAIAGYLSVSAFRLSKSFNQPPSL